MHQDLIKEKLSNLNSQLRIMILQNAREEDGYDDRVLLEMNRITNQILDLKRSLRREKANRKRVIYSHAQKYSLQ
ncbi:MAG: hypothetical protein P8X42_10530 [Calditrichaceae bacterium]|jgi:hypothetical protein